MACSHPLVRKNEDGQITTLDRYLHWHNAYKQNERPDIAEAELKRMLKEDRAQLLPCGKCINCRLSQSAAWANRMEMELGYHKDNWFLTLTYRDQDVPHGYKVDKTTGEILVENLTLVPKDLQDFIKRLRRNIEYHKRGEPNLMYFACGEYGEQTHRPHYHAIIYDLPIKTEELRELKRKNGYIYYTCEWLEKVWGKGNIILGAVTWESCAYVARYIVKKRKGKDAKEWYESLGIEPEFVRMSKNPAIGARYYEENHERIYESDSIQLSRGRQCKPPRYFDKMFDADSIRNELAAVQTWGNQFDMEAVSVKAESEELKAIKRKRRKIANDTLFAQLAKTTKPIDEYLLLQEAKRINQAKKLVRPDN
uniref:Replication initiator protein n=1 Tax=Dulem virus 205 TaxID=3145682 RepID=A0AAU8B9X8_9VIRU